MKIKSEFHGIFGSQESVFDEFAVPEEDKKGVTILFAWYEYQDYSGEAFVLFRKNRKLYEVYGSHCSCYGLEDQWEPEQCYMKELKLRAERVMGTGDGEVYYTYLHDFLQKNFKQKRKKK